MEMLDSKMIRSYRSYPLSDILADLTDRFSNVTVNDVLDDLASTNEFTWGDTSHVLINTDWAIRWLTHYVGSYQFSDRVMVPGGTVVDGDEIDDEIDRFIESLKSFFRTNKIDYVDLRE